jgi:hypothetical protein
MSEKEHQIIVLVSKEVKSKLKMVCGANGRSMSGYCAEAVRNQLVKDWDGARAKVAEMASHPLPGNTDPDVDL